MTNIATARAQRPHSIIGASIDKLVTVSAIMAPYALVGLLLRLVMARLFFLSGQAKIEGPRIPVHFNFPGTDFSIIDFNLILPQESQQPIVGVCPHAEIFRGVRRRVVEDPEKYRRVVGIALDKVAAWQSEAVRDGG